MLWLLLSTIVLISSVSFAFADWKAGVASRVITPEEQLWMAGYGARNEPSQGTIQDLYVKALTFEDEKGTRVVIVTSDLCIYPYDFTGTVSKEIEKRFSIPREAILFNASHNHMGPELWSKTGLVDPPEWLHDIPEPQVQKVIRYTEWLKKQFIDTIGDAVADLKPASVFFSSAMPVPFAVSRRFPSPSMPRA